MAAHFDKCAEHVADYAFRLAEKVRAGKLNHSATEALIDSYLEAPAFHPEWRPRLKEIAATQLGGF